MSSDHHLTFNFNSTDRTEQREVSIKHAVIAGWTGRNVEAMEEHIVELEALGVPRPPTTPVFYRVGAARLTNAEAIQAAGEHSSGEVEFILLQCDGELWIGVGSDHTDRKVETYNITVSKQMCDKPVATELWPYKEVADHWDDLMLCAYIESGGEKVLYQQGPVSTMLSPLELIQRYTGTESAMEEGTLMFGGTFAVIGEIRGTERFEISLQDPVLDRHISFGYEIHTLPLII